MSECKGCDACEASPCNGGCIAEVRDGRNVHICRDEDACFVAFARLQRTTKEAGE